MPSADLPAATDRTYIQITPTDDPLDPATVGAAFRRLHGLDHSTADGAHPRSRLRALLPTLSPKPTIEWLLSADPASEPTVTYAVGVDPPSLTTPLEGILRDCFPRSYEFDRLDVNPATPALQPADTQTAIEIHGRPDRPADWQTRLTPIERFYDAEADRRVPLSGILETLAAVDAPAVWQVCVQPYPDWSGEASLRREHLESGTDTLGGKLEHAIFGAPAEYEPPAADRQRLAELDAKNARRSFAVSVRVLTDDASVATALETALGHVGHTTFELAAERSTDVAAVRKAVQERTVYAPDYGGLQANLPGHSPAARGLIADPDELGSFCLVDGGALTTDGARAIAPTPGERTARGPPPGDRLRPYRSDGLTLGRPLDADGQPTTQSIALPPSLQPLHSAIFGKTGAGKTTLALRAMLDNHAATDGADIVIAPKGDGMPIEFLRAHYARYNSLDNVVYFDCQQVLPALSFFDIRPDLAAGVDRTTAVEDRVDHYLEILRSVMGRERFEQAVRSPDIIRFLVKALFDPVSGNDAFSHRELHTAVQRMHDRQTAPPVADADLERMLAGVVANTGRTFDELMQGVANRIEKIPVDRRLARIFNHVPADGDPTFDLADVLDEDVVVIFDTGGLRNEAQRVLALVVLSNLWSALRRRAKDRSEPGADIEDDDLPLVNLYVEEAGSVAVSTLLTDLLAQGRGFGCAVTLLMQFPGQLGSNSNGAYDELVNNVSTVVTGNVPNDRRLARRLATDDLAPGDVANRLRALARGEWLVSLPSEFDSPEPRPFTVGSPTPPPGTGASDRDLSATRRARFPDAFHRCRDRTLDRAGLRLSNPSTAHFVDGPADAAEPSRVDSALPYTQRIPPTVEYRPDGHLLACRECDSKYDADIDGMRQAIDCCGDLGRVDREDVPICDVPLKLTPSERDVTTYTDAQLLFLQAVFTAQQLRYDPLEYDLLQDSMLRLQEYVDIDSDAIDDLIDDGLLTHDTDRPHRLYSVSPDGRQVIGAQFRRGHEYGHGQGDLEETSHHVLAVEAARRYLVQAYREAPESSVTEVVPYFDLERENGPVISLASAMGDPGDDLQEAYDEYDHRRLDVAALDSDGQVVVAVEAERINHDHRRAVPADYDKMADCDPDEALWVAMSHDDAHEILQALNDPLEGEPRVEKTYAESTPANQFRLETPGCTEMLTLKQVLEHVPTKA